jgi:hypothetical protein
MAVLPGPVQAFWPFQPAFLQKNFEIKCSLNLNNFFVYIFFMSDQIFLHWPGSSAKSWQHWQQGKEKPAEHICFAVDKVIKSLVTQISGNI